MPTWLVSLLSPLSKSVIWVRDSVSTPVIIEITGKPECGHFGPDYWQPRVCVRAKNRQRLSGVRLRLVSATPERWPSWLHLSDDNDGGHTKSTDTGDTCNTERPLYFDVAFHRAADDWWTIDYGNPSVNSQYHEPLPAVKTTVRLQLEASGRYDNRGSFREVFRFFDLTVDPSGAITLELAPDGS